MTNEIKPGDRFGQLTALEDVGRNKGGNIMWRCRCDCGQERIVPGYRLANGSATVCDYTRHYKVDGTDLNLLRCEPTKNNTSGLVGVSYINRYRVWSAEIYLAGKRHSLGHYDNIVDAAEARREAERELYDPVLIAHGLPPTSEDEYQRHLQIAIERAAKIERDAEQACTEDFSDVEG